jgi:Abortive infection C-terminus
LERRASDPEGAITSARALLETVCKHVLDDLGIGYDESADLPKLYRLTSEALKVAPSQHTEHVFKQILGGCTAVVEGLGSLRNRLGDAHGGGRSRVKPAARHAQLAVNLAGAMTSFLVATWEARKNVRP